MPSITDANHGSGVKRLELETAQIQNLFGPLVTGEVNLEPMIEQESIDTVGFEPPPGSLVGFQDHDIEPCIDQAFRSSQSGKSCSDDDRVIYPGIRSKPRASHSGSPSLGAVARVFGFLSLGFSR